MIPTKQFLVASSDAGVLDAELSTAGRAVEILNHYRPKDMPDIAVADIERTLLRMRA